MVKVYLASIAFLEQEEEFLHWYERANRYCQDKIDLITPVADKRRSLAAWHLLNYALEKEGLQNFVMWEGENGKPYLNEGNLYFNLSHSGELVACAVSKEEVGIDIQKNDLKKDVLKIANRFFTKKEIEFLTKVQEEVRVNLFLQLWCIKESYIKYTGTGLRKGLSHFTVDYDAKQIITRNGNETSKFEVFNGNDYCIAVCAKNGEIEKPKNINLQNNSSSIWEN